MQREGSTHDRSHQGHGRDQDEGGRHDEFRGAERGVEQSGAQGQRYGGQRSEENPMNDGKSGRSGYGTGSQSGYGQSGSQQSQHRQAQQGQSQHGQSRSGQSGYGQQGSGQQGYEYGEETVGPGDYGQAESHDQQGSYGAGNMGSGSGQSAYGQSGMNQQGMNRTGYSRPGIGQSGYGQSGDRQSGYGRPDHTSGQRRLDGVFSGKAPKGYTRSDTRLEEDINERLMHDPHIDPTDIEVKVEQGEVTLSGVVGSRQDKFEIEELVDNIVGVKDVTNNIKVTRASAGGVRSEPKSDPGSTVSPGLSTGGATASNSSKTSSDEGNSSKRR